MKILKLTKKQAVFALVLGTMSIFSCSKEEDAAFTLTTTTPSRVTGTSAFSGGEFSNAEKLSFSEVGVVTSLQPNDTKRTSNFTVSPSNNKSYTTVLENLKPSTTYYIQAYAIKSGSKSITYGNEVKFTTTLNIGTKMHGGEVAYVFQPGDPGYVEGEVHGLVIPLNEEKIGLIWGCSGTFISGARGTALGTGKANTEAIVKECATTNIAAKVCSDLVSGGYSDWFLPSIDELVKIDQNISLLTGISQKGFNFLSSSQTSSSTVYTQYVHSGQAFRKEDGSKSTKDYYHVIPCRYF